MNTKSKLAVLFLATSLFSAPLSAQPTAITVPPSSRPLFAGAPILLRVLATGTPTLTYQWRRDGTSLAGATKSIFSVTNAAPSNSAPYDVVVSGPGGSVTSAPVAVVVTALPVGYSPSTLETNLATSLDVDGPVRAIETLANGSFYLAGSFVTVQGLERVDVARFDSNGLVDPSFNPPSNLPPPLNNNGTVFALVAQPDGKIIIGGDISAPGAYTNLARLNPDGSFDTTFVPHITHKVQCLALQPDGRIIVGGAALFTRLNTNGTSDATFTPSVAFDTILYDSVSSVAVQPDGKILYATLEGSVGSSSAHPSLFRLLTNGVSDPGFVTTKTVPPTGSPTYALNETYSMKLQPNGKIVIGNGSIVVRFNSDGVFDTGFTLPVVASSLRGGPYRLTLVGGDATHDSRVLLGGNFTAVNTNSSRSSLAFFETNGVLLAGYTPGIAAPSTPWVYALATRPDGSVVVGGSFAQLGGQIRRNFGIFKPDGSFDTNFYVGKGGYCVQTQTAVWTLAPLTDNRILVGGDFTLWDGVARARVARLLPDASLDLTFDPGTGANSTVLALALQADGKALVGGSFTNFNGRTCSGLVRLNADGSIDSSFNTALGSGASVVALAVQPDQHVLVGGTFTNVNGTAQMNFARLNTDGTLDTNFSSGLTLNGPVNAMAAMADGKIVIGGSFSQVNGASRQYLAAFLSDGSLAPNFGQAYSLPQQVTALAATRSGGLYVALYFGANGFSSLWLLQSDGTVDPFFNNRNSYTTYIGSILAQLDGRVIIAGGNSYSLESFYPNSSLDSSFSPIYANPVTTMAFQADGHLLLGGGKMLLQPVAGGPFITRDGLAQLEGEFALVNLLRPSLLAPSPGSLPFQPQLQATPGWTYSLEATSDFSIWTPITNVVMPASGILTLPDNDSLNLPHRYYRARLQ